MLTVLLVDPSSFTRKKLARALEERGYRVIEAASGQAAFRAGADSAPDLVVMARWLPDVDGLGAMRQLRHMDPGLPVVFTGPAERPGDPWGPRRAPLPDPLATAEEQERIFRAIARLLSPVVA